MLEKYAEAFQDQSIKKKEQSILSSPEDARDTKDFSVTALLRNDNPLPPANHQLPAIDAVYSDLIYVKSEKPEVRSKDMVFKKIENSELNIYHSVIRYWKAHNLGNGVKKTINESLITNKLLLNGWMPPHPTLFIKKEIFAKYGLYRTDMKIAADYEMVLRLFYKHRITANYLPLTTYCMTIGGASNKSLKNILLKSKEDFRAMILHSLPIPLKTLFFKNISKLTQFIRR